MVSRGCYRRTVGGRAVDYAVGALTLLRSDDAHADSYAAGSRCLHVVIPSVVEERLMALGRRVSVGKFSPELSAHFFVALQNEFRHPDGDSPLIVEALLLDLVSRQLDLQLERSAARPGWLGLLLEYLDDSYPDRWSLGSMAREMGVHPVHLCRTFSDHFACTLGEYIRRQRVLRGWQLVAIGDETLARVAAQAGFADQSHFSRAFKDRFHITPGEWRRQSRRRLRSASARPVS